MPQSVPASRQVTKGGHPLANSSVLQTYDIHTDNHISRQALARTNATTLRVSPEGSQITAPDVTHLSVSQDGKWMATIDDWYPYPQDVQALELNGEKSSNAVRETFLKLWRWDNSSGLWELAARIDAPHFSEYNPVPVLDLASRPRSHDFATIGCDMVLRVWCPSTRHHNGLGTGSEAPLRETWKCRNTIDMNGYVIGHNPGECSAASINFSEDGSVLAVCPQSASSNTGLAVLIDTQSYEVRHSRTGLYSGELYGAKFLGCHLIIASKESVSIWNTVDDIVRTVNLAEANSSFATGSQLLAVNPKSQTFALATQHLENEAAKKKSRKSAFYAMFLTLVNPIRWPYNFSLV
ncbi:hypothetical protein EYZ11_005440 [Aspergillus tanneri]|uniref:Uncharacterized protein n=1 Tax=Aspergillus tanneri TaxID=1220188 RepID=A0A4S3JIB6_9EURO|nr:hypothetical protein EYZ11_005440 [Aspergillus tanneri]